MAKQRVAGYYIVRRKNMQFSEIAFYNDGIFLLTGIERYFYEDDFEWIRFLQIDID